MLNCRNQNSRTRSSYSGQCKKTYLSRAYSVLICFVTCLWHLTSAHVVEHGYNSRKEAWDTQQVHCWVIVFARGKRGSQLKIGENWTLMGLFCQWTGKKRGLVLSNCLHIADLTFRLINLHNFCTVQKKAWGSMSIHDLLFNKRRSFFWLSPNFSTERKLAVSQP